MPEVHFHRNQIFYRLPGTLCQTLYDTGEIKSVPAGEIILNEGDELDSLYIVLTGRTEAILPKTESRAGAVRLSELGPGDCFGEYAFIDQQPASATIRALTDAEVARIGYDALRRFLDAHPTVGSIVYQNLLHILVRRLRLSNAELDLFTLSVTGQESADWVSPHGAGTGLDSLPDWSSVQTAGIEEILDQFFQAVTDQDMSQLPLANKVTYSGTMLPKPAEGADAVRNYMSETAPFIKSFSIKEMVIGDHSAAVLVRYRGVNDVSFEGCYVIEVEGDQITRIRTVFDSRPLIQGTAEN